MHLLLHNNGHDNELQLRNLNGFLYSQDHGQMSSLNNGHAHTSMPKTSPEKCTCGISAGFRTVCPVGTSTGAGCTCSSTQQQEETPKRVPVTNMYGADSAIRNASISITSTVSVSATLRRGASAQTLKGEPARPAQQGQRPPCRCTATVESRRLDLSDLPLCHDKDVDDIVVGLQRRTLTKFLHCLDHRHCC